jgi:hypothetical protein
MRSECRASGAAGVAWGGGARGGAAASACGDAEISTAMCRKLDWLAPDSFLATLVDAHPDYELHSPRQADPSSHHILLAFGLHRRMCPPAPSTVNSGWTRPSLMRSRPSDGSTLCLREWHKLELSRCLPFQFQRHRPGGGARRRLPYSLRR